MFPLAVIADLGQNPKARPRWSDAHALHTLTRSSSRCWLISQNRFISGVELLMSHGFPLSSWAAEAAGLDAEGWARGMLATNTGAASLAGNSMHITCVGLCVFCVLLAVPQ